MELLTNPILWLGVAIVVIALIESKRQKSSPKCQGANKTSYATKPTYASSGKKEVAKKMAEKIASTPKKTATKQTAKKKVAKRRVAKKTTPKKSPKKN